MVERGVWEMGVGDNLVGSQPAPPATGREDAGVSRLSVDSH